MVRGRVDSLSDADLWVGGIGDVDELGTFQDDLLTLLQV
jgi:hypothetical protein